MANQPSNRGGSSKPTSAPSKSPSKGSASKVNGVTSAHLPAHVRRPEKGSVGLKGKWLAWPGLGD